MIRLNKFEIGFYGGYIKSALRLARMIKHAASLEEAKEIAEEMEERALKKPWIIFKKEIMLIRVYEYVCHAQKNS